MKSTVSEIMQNDFLNESEWLQMLLRYSTDGIHILDNRGFLIQSTHQFCDMLGYSSCSEMQGMHISEWETQLSLEQIQKKISEELDQPERRFVFESRHRKKNGSLIDVEITTQAIPIQDRLLIFASSREITPRKVLEQNLEDYSHRLNRLIEFNQLLSEINEITARADNGDYLLNRICQLTVERTRTKLACLLRPNHQGSFQVIVAAGHTNYLRNIQISKHKDLPEGQGVMGRAWRSQQPIFVQSIIHDPKMAPWHQKALEYGFTATASLPIFRQGKPWAIFSVYQDEENLFDEDLQKILRDISKDISFGLDHLETLTAQQQADAFNVALLHNLKVGINVVRYPDRVIERINQRLMQMYGATSLEEITGRSVKDFYPDEKTYRLVGSFSKKILNGESGLLREVPFRRLDGEIIYVDLTGQVLKLNGKNVSKIVWTYIDVTERHRKDEAIKRLNHERQMLLSNTTAGIDMVRYPERTVSEANQAFMDIMGYQKIEDLIGKDTQCFYPSIEENNRMENLSRKVLHKGYGNLRDLKIRRQDGTIIYLDISGRKLDSSNPEHPIIVWTSIDVTERYELNKKLSRQALTDPLTQLPNRRALDLELEKAIARANRHKRLLAIVMVDLDEFKPINDTHGHELGDKVLQVIADRLLQTIRKTDYASRLGGDEFVLLLEDCQSVSEISTVLDKISRTIRVPIPFQQKNQTFSVSINLSAGVCIYPFEDTSNPDTLLRKADQALYESKNHKLNRRAFWTLYGDSFQAKPSDIQNLLTNGGLRVWYQPILDNLSRKIVGIEALARIETRDKEILLPNIFLAHLNQEDIFNLSQNVLTQAIKDLAYLDQKGIKLWGSVNVDPISISDHCVSCLEKVLSESCIEPSRVILEILEGTNFSQQKKAVEHLKSLKRLGVRLALDDIGSAYSSLLHLKDLPIDEIKLDQEFIRTIPIEPSGIIFAETIHDLAADLDVSMVAEGVENDEILDTMTVLNIPFLQGYAIAKPMPLDALPAFLEHEPITHRHHPVSLLGLYAKHVAYDRNIQKTLKHDPKLITNAKLRDILACPFTKSFHDLDLPDHHPIASLHQSYHATLAQIHSQMLNSQASPDWTSLTKIHHQLLDTIWLEISKSRKDHHPY